MKKAETNTELTNFYKAVLALKTEEECRSFFDDLLTPNELISIPQRLEVAQMLLEGQAFLEITEKTGASTATIGRVSRCLKSGSEGYRTILGRIK